MNKVPMAVLLNALLALKLAHAKLNNNSAPDPYLAVVKSMHELEHAIKSLNHVEVSNV